MLQNGEKLIDLVHAVKDQVNEMGLSDEMFNCITYHPSQNAQPLMYDSVRSVTKLYASLIENLLPDSPEKTQALVNLQQTMFWANASVARRTNG